MREGGRGGESGCERREVYLAIRTRACETSE